MQASSESQQEQQQEPVEIEEDAGFKAFMAFHEIQLYGV
jgi:hypothetical protein